MKQSTTDYLEGNWKQLSGRIKEAWGAITDDDLQRAEGQAEQLIGIIQERTGKERADIERRLEALVTDIEARRNLEAKRSAARSGAPGV